MNSVCIKCGQKIALDSVFCSICGTPQKPLSNQPITGDFEGFASSGGMPPPLPLQAPSVPQQMPYVPNNLALAIVCIVFCWPLGIPAVIYASQVDGFLRSGNYQAAVAQSRLAKKWSFWGLGVFASIIILYFLFFIGMIVLVGITSHHK